MQYVFKFDFTRDDRLECGSYAPGDEVLVYSRLNNMTGYEEYRISKRFAKSGYPGNMDRNQTRFHGWRGTTNDIAVYAYGVYTIKSIDYNNDDATIRIELNRKDIRKEDA